MLKPVRFQLNHASAKQSGSGYGSREFSVWVSGLSEDVDQEQLAKTFRTRFGSVKSVKVVEDGRDGGRRYGFVRFGDQNDQREALIHMNGFLGLGDKPIKLSIATPKPGLTEAASLTADDAYSDPSYSGYYEQYWADQAAWGNYGQYQGSTSDGKHRPPVLYSGAGGKTVSTEFADGFGRSRDETEEDEEEEGEDEDRVIDHSLPVNVDAMNSEFVARSQEVWDAVEKDRWLYNLDNDEGFVPNFNKSRTLRTDQEGE